jgi:hypothetical protein
MLNTRSASGRVRARVRIPMTRLTRILCIRHRIHDPRFLVAAVSSRASLVANGPRFEAGAFWLLCRRMTAGFVLGSLSRS